MRLEPIGWFILVTSPFFQQSNKLKTLGEIKVWQFHVRNGEISVKLSSYPDKQNKQTSLWLQPQNGFLPTAAEEADLLGQVLSEMPRLGYDPTSLVLITTPTDNSEFKDGINEAVAKSGKWRSCIRQKYCHEAQPIANQYLASVNAYKEFDDVLARYRLRRKLPTTDDMACSVTQPPSTVAGQEANSRVSCGAVIDTPIEKTKER